MRVKTPKTVPQVLRSIASYYRTHPDAIRNGYHLGFAVVDISDSDRDLKRRTIGALREAVGEHPDAPGRLAAWSKGKTAEDAIALLERVASEQEGK